MSDTMSPPVNQRLIDLLNYINRYVKTDDSTITQVEQYKGFSLYEHNLSELPGILVNEIESEEPVWMIINRLSPNPPPEPEMTIQPWIEVVNDPTQTPIVHDMISQLLPLAQLHELLDQNRITQNDISLPEGLTLTDVKEATVTLKLENCSEIKQSINNYIDSKWQTWSESETQRRQTIKIYSRLFEIQQILSDQSVEQPLELIWGVGCVLWKTNKSLIKHPLIEFYVEIEIDAKTSDLIIHPRDRDPFYNEHIFAEQDLRNINDLKENWFNHLSQMKEQEDDEHDNDISPFNANFYAPPLKFAVSYLSNNGQYYPEISDDKQSRDLPKIEDSLMITDTWILYSRTRSNNVFIQDINALMAKASTVLPEDIPPFANRIIYGPPEKSNANTGIPLSADASSKDETHDIIYPKPYNDAQLNIVKKLITEDGVVVQGPPGTGKTHTISNIIAHYLAQGKRILVTSKGEPALDVLRDQIPDKIRDLCISLLTQDRQGLKQIETAVRTIANTVQSINEGESIKKIQSLDTTIQSLSEKFVAIDQQLEALAKEQLEPAPLEFGKAYQGKKACELAEALVENQASYRWFPDNLHHQQEIQFDEEDLQFVKKLREQVGEKIVYSQIKLPKAKDLPDTPNLLFAHEQLVIESRLLAQFSQQALPVMSMLPDNALQRAKQVSDHLKTIQNFLNALPDFLWLEPIYKDWLQQGFETSKYHAVYTLYIQIKEISDIRKTLIRPLDLPTSYQYDTTVEQALSKAANGQKPFGFFEFGKTNAKNLIHSIRIDGHSPQSPDDWQYIKRWFDYHQKFNILLGRWNFLATDYQLPILEPSASDAERKLLIYVEQLHQAYVIVHEMKPIIKQELAELFPQGIYEKDLISSIESTQKVSQILSINIEKNSFKKANQILEHTRNQFALDSNPLVEEFQTFLTQSLGNQEHSASEIETQWDQLLLQLRKLNDLEDDFIKFQSIIDKIRVSGAPQWAHKLSHMPSLDGIDPLLPDNWRQCWNWKRMESYLRQIDSQEQIKKLANERQQAVVLREKKLLELVKLKTELGLQSRLNDQVKSNLFLYISALSRIGKGTGKKAPRYRREAKEAMQKCYSAVPCWIMPTWRVSESLPAEYGTFDIVIIDEASQSDITATPALLRGKKVLIVGDDKQVSPEGNFVLESRVQQLKRDYLKNFQLKSLMLPGNSIYELGKAMFPGSLILLNEHFRCVEPIIRFSFDFYEEKILPVRVPKPSERLNPPLIDVFVKGGKKEKKINIAEANAIVSEIEAIVNDPAYDERSIGVISLTGNDQAKYIQKQLVTRIGEHHYIKHKITCGDSSIFQGKERDIILLSMIASPGQARALTSRMFQQRFNVALSRAKDRMYLYRSVDFDDLNDKDLRYKVLQHFKNPMPDDNRNVKELIELCQSNFERDFFNKMVSLGYRIIPQVGVGGYYIDFIIEGENDRRLAIELDGDFHMEQWQEDLKRQRLLERTGLHFWRCWHSSYILDSDHCIQDLINTLNEMEIKPIGFEAELNLYTEHRLIKASPQPADLQSTLAEIDLSDEPLIEVGDKVNLVSQNGNDQSYQSTIMITNETHNPSAGLYHVDSEETKPLLGLSIDDEIEFFFNGKKQNVLIQAIEKSRA